MGNHDSANLVLDWMMADGHSLNSSFSGFLVGLFTDSGRFDIAQKLLALAECGETEGNPFVYNKFLNGLVRQNRIDDAVNFFSEQMMLKSCLDACSFNILIRGLCKTGQVDKALNFFEEMVKFGLSPDVITYNTIIDGLCRVNKVDKARELLLEVRSRNGVSPDVVTYTSIISGYCKLNMMEEASVLFQEMISNGIRPTLITFNILIDGFGKVGNMASVSAMYEKMLFLGCLPDVVTFTSHIDGYCRIGQVGEASKLWKEMVDRKLFPNKYTFSILIIALCKENRLNEACDLLRQLKLRNDIIPQPFMYNPVIDGLCKAGKVDEANLVVSEMEERRCKHDKYTFTILIIGHCMKGRMLEAIKIFNRMLSVKCNPDDITIKSLLSCLVKAGMSDEASQIKKRVALGKVEVGLSTSRGKFPARTNMDIQTAIETRNNKLEMQSVNKKSLIEELDKLLERSRVPSEYATCLAGGSFDESNMIKNIEACEWLSGALRGLEVPNLYTTFGNMRAVREKKAEVDKLKSTFVRRASEFLRNYFASLVDFMISDKSYFSQRGQLKRPDHADLRYRCRTYARLLQHLKVLTLQTVLIYACFSCLISSLSFDVPEP
ncbi:hypothetical protein SOVF_003670 isoform C [Spinacia oleracea]|nr:hypothetical protein SOVF_003670 isoform C [Spinacia oleracea]